MKCGNWLNSVLESVIIITIKRQFMKLFKSCHVNKECEIWRTERTNR